MIASTAASYCIVDVCDTLVHGDTTIGFIRSHLKRSRRAWLRRMLFLTLTSARSPVNALFRMIEKACQRHVLKGLLLRMLSGESSQSVRASARTYAAEILNEHRCEQVWRLVQSEILAGRQLILASASLEPVVAALADQMGADFVASSLEYRDDALTGKYASDITGRKREALAAKLGVDIDQRCTVISDNLSDLELIRAARTSYVVIRKRSHYKRWNGVTAKFIEVLG